MTAQQKHQTIRSKLASRRVFVVTFSKKDGSLRTMRCQYEGGPIRRNLITVRDLDLNEVRMVNADTVHTLWAVHDREPARRSYEQVKAEVDQLFY